MISRLARAACAAGTLALLLAGCGTDGQPAQTPAGTDPVSGGQASTGPAVPAGSTTTAAGSADPCLLVTRQEASAAFGAPSSPPQPAASASAAGKACAYFANASRDSLQVSLLRGASQSQVSAITSSVELPGAAVSTESGIGNSARVTWAGPTVVVIFTQQSDLVIVTLTRIGQPAPVHAALVLAKDAAARL